MIADTVIEFRILVILFPYGIDVWIGGSTNIEPSIPPTNLPFTLPPGSITRTTVRYGAYIPNDSGRNKSTSTRHQLANKMASHNFFRYFCFLLKATFVDSGSQSMSMVDSEIFCWQAVLLNRHFFSSGVNRVRVTLLCAVFEESGVPISCLFVVGQPDPTINDHIICERTPGKLWTPNVTLSCCSDDEWSESISKILVNYLSWNWRW